MKRRSDKRRALDAEYSTSRVEYLNRHPWCRGRGLLPRSRCTTWATEIHHTRGRVGKDYLDQSTWLALCSNCHRWVTEHPAEAREAGLSYHRNEVRHDDDELAHQRHDETGSPDQRVDPTT